MGSSRGSRLASALSSDRPGHAAWLLGNEAVVRGALEAGVGFVAGYPGTPSSEVTDTFAALHGHRGLEFEYSVNEKIAVEMAFAASLAGVRSLCAMKHLGLMAAGDPISTIPYIGVRGGMVIVSAGDPSCRTSPNEQDQRYLGPMLHIPVLDPSTPAEARELTRFAFDLSEESELPVLLRITTRVCHARSEVVFGPMREPLSARFVRDPRRLVPLPAHARRMRLEIPARLERARALAVEEGLVAKRGDGRSLVLMSGSPAAITNDLLDDLDPEGRIARLSLSIVHPLPERALLDALEDVDRVLIVEELSPFLEDALAALVGRARANVEILGKRSGHLPESFEYEPPIVQRALAECFGLPEPAEPAEPPEVPIRPPSLCPGCPHRASYVVARSVFAEDQLYFNDIGCYTLGFGPPLETVDALLCMGAGFTLAAGVARVTGDRTVGFMGDGTFFHSGMPALLDAIKEGADIVAIILDNRVTAMTGFQEVTPSGGDRDVSIAEIARSLGAAHVETVDPFDLDATAAAFARARDARGVSVVVVERECPVFQVRRHSGSEPPPTEALTFVIDPERCRVCGREEAGLRCGQAMTLGFERSLARAQGERESIGGLPVDRAPCSVECPLSLCVQGYAGHIAAGEHAEALGHILERTALPESVCRVCHRPCERACPSGVQINGLKRFVVDWARAQDEYPWVPPPAAPRDERVAVVGAGPSGLSAAAELRRRGYGVTLFDARERAGGLLDRCLPVSRLPVDAIERDVARVLSAGVRFEGGRVLGKNLTIDELFERGYAAIYLGIGGGSAARLDVPSGEGAPLLVDALSFLERERSGRSEGVPPRVVVVGGGNAAIDAARTALRSGAERVEIVCLEARRDMPALEEELGAALAEGVVVRNRTEPVRLADGVVQLRPLDGGEEIRVPADLVIAAIGQRPDLSPFAEGAPALAQEDGRLVVDPERCRTSHARIFAGGDMVAGERTVTAAMAWGLRAAWSIDRELAGEAVADRRPPPPLAPRALAAVAEARARGASPVVQPGDEETRTSVPDHDPAGQGPLPVSHSPRLPANEPGLPPARPITARASPKRSLPMWTDARPMQEQRLLGEAEARVDAALCAQCGRCGNCRVCIDVLGCPAITWSEGRVGIDAALCNGCGVCRDLCPNGAIVAQVRA